MSNVGQDDYTAVNFGGMADAEADFLIVYKAVEDELEDLNKDLVSLLGEWVGQANNQYGQTMDKWNRGAADMAQTLKNLHMTIGQVHSNYSEAEQHNARLWDA